MEYTYEHIDEHHKAVKHTDNGYVLDSNSIFNMNTAIKISIPITCLGYLYALRVSSNFPIVCKKSICVVESLQCPELTVKLDTQCGSLQVENAYLQSLKADTVKSGNINCTVALVEDLSVKNITCTEKLVVLRNAKVDSVLKASRLIVKESLMAETLYIGTTCDVTGTITANTYVLEDNTYDKLVKVHYNENNILLFKSSIIINGTIIKHINTTNTRIKNITFDKNRYTTVDWWDSIRNEIDSIHASIYAKAAISNI